MFFFLLVLLAVGLWFLPSVIWLKLDSLTSSAKSLRLIRPSLVANGKQAWHWVQTGEGEWPEYKFYGSLLRELQRLTRLYGATPKASLERIKRPLLQDIRFETKLREIRLSSISQFVAMATMTWSFMILSRLILDRSFEFGILTIIASLQIAGLLIFLFIEKYMRTKAFHGFDKAYEGLVALQALLPLGLSLKEKRDKSGIDHFLSLKRLGIDLERVRRQCVITLTQWKELGRPLETVLAEMVDDINFAQDMAQCLLIKRMNGIKFLVGGIFFLSAYLLDLLALVNSFFIE